MNSWTFGDQVSLWAVNVVLQAGLVAAAALTIGLGLRRAAALRYGLMLAGLVLISLIPLTVSLAQWSGRSWLSLSISQLDVERMPAATRPTVTQPGRASAWPAPSRGSDVAEQPFADSSFNFAPRRPNRLEPVASERPRLPDASAMRSSASHADPLPPRPAAATWGSALRMAVLPVLAIWLAGSLGLLVKLAVGYVRLARILDAAKPHRDPAIADVFAEVRRALRLEKLPPIVFSDQVLEPCSAGLLSPRIVLPERMVGQVTPRQLRDVLLHEAAHIARRDQAIVLLQNVVAALFWLHPLVKLLNRQLAQAREEVCDNWVLAATDAPSYSRTLLTLTQLLCSPTPLAGTVCLFTSRWKLESRVAGLLDARRNRRTGLSRSGRALVGIVALALSGILSSCTISMAVPTDDNQSRAGADAQTQQAANPQCAANVAEPANPAEETPDDGLLSLRLTVRMPDGSPAAGAIVESSHQRSELNQTLRTDEHGKVTIRDAFDNGCQICVRSPDGRFQATFRESGSNARTALAKPRN